MKMYKGFDKDLQCRGFQFEIGKSYHEDSAKLCNTGFHACENPLDVFSYYPPLESRYCRVTLEGITTEEERDSKRYGTDIVINSEIDLKTLIDAATTGDFAHAATTGDGAHAATTGDRAHAATTGYGAHAATTGDRAHAATTGDFARAIVKGENSIAVALGIGSFAAAPIGGFIVLADWREIDGEQKLCDVKTFLVDGEKVKENTYYTLQNGELKEKC